jgi:hypothetical protein
MRMLMQVNSQQEESKYSNSDDEFQSTSRHQSHLALQRIVQDLMA